MKLTRRFLLASIFAAPFIAAAKLRRKPFWRWHPGAIRPDWAENGYMGELPASEMDRMLDEISRKTLEQQRRELIGFVFGSTVPK